MTAKQLAGHVHCGVSLPAQWGKGINAKLSAFSFLNMLLSSFAEPPPHCWSPLWKMSLQTTMLMRKIPLASTSFQPHSGWLLPLCLINYYFESIL